MLEFAIRKLTPEHSLTDYRLRTLPEWRRRKVLSYLRDIDRRQCAEAFDLLRTLLARHFGLTIDREFEYSAEGKPRLAGVSGVHFNISHCPEAVMAAVSDAPVGCDIEKIHDRPDEDVMDICYSQSERQRVLESPTPAATFTEIWTRKETLYKLDNRFSVDTPTDSAAISPSHILHTVIRPTYVYTVASNSPACRDVLTRL